MIDDDDDDGILCFTRLYLLGGDACGWKLSLWWRSISSRHQYQNLFLSRGYFVDEGGTGLIFISNISESEEEKSCQVH